MPSVTALALVNRTRILRRQPPVTAFTTDEDTVSLNAVNMAVENILGTRNWDFDLRHDGQFLTRPPVDLDLVGSLPLGTTATVTHSSSTLTAANFGDGEVVTRLISYDEDDIGNTPIRIDSWVGPIGLSTTINLNVAAPTGMTDTNSEFIYQEYLLPDTVRSVVRVTFKEQTLNLENISASTRFDEIYPGNADEQGSPISIAVGGFDEGTYNITDDTAEAKLRAVVYPIPDDQYVLDYSYYYRHPELVAATDTLTGVPPAVVNDIVEEATGIVGINWDGDLSAQHFSDRAQMQSDAKNKVQSPNRTRRNTIRPYGSSERTLRGFPGRLIG